MSQDKILIVDDEPSNVNVLASILEGHYQLYIATDGQMALDVIANQDVVLILLDIIMPKMDGLEVAITLSKDPKHCDIPIIFLTARDDQETMTKAFEAGGNDFLNKPFKKAELLARIKHHLEAYNLKKDLISQKQHTQNILDSQTSIIIETDGEVIINGNRALLEFFQESTIDDFREKHQCVCYSFLDEEGYVYNQEDKNWIEIILENNKKEEDSYVKMCSLQTGNTHTFIAHLVKNKNFIVSFYDITKRMEYEEKIAFLNSQFQSITESIPDVLYRRDLNENSGLMYINSSCNSLTGYSPEELLEDNMGFCNIVKKEDRALVFDEIKKTLAQENSFEVVYQIVRKDGSFGWVKDKGRKVNNLDGTSVIEGILIDISLEVEHDEKLNKEIKNAVEKYKAQQETLFRQSKSAAMGDMLAAIAHQLKQPINVLGLHMQLLSEDYSYGDVNESYIQDHEKRGMEQIHHMSKTIDQFKNFLSPNKEKKYFQLESVVSNILSLMEKQLKLHSIEVKTDMKGISIYGISGEMEQVLLNLIGNAKDAIFSAQKENSSLTGKISITAQQNGEETIICVEDNAGGIKNSTLEKVFDPYFTTKGDKGTGIGLFMTKTIIEDGLNGEITVHNENEGAQFTIKIPVINN